MITFKEYHQLREATTVPPGDTSPIRKALVPYAKDALRNVGLGAGLIAGAAAAELLGLGPWGTLLAAGTAGIGSSIGGNLSDRWLGKSKGLDEDDDIKYFKTSSTHTYKFENIEKFTIDPLDMGVENINFMVFITSRLYNELTTLNITPGTGPISIGLDFQKKLIKVFNSSGSDRRTTAHKDFYKEPKKDLHPLILGEYDRRVERYTRYYLDRAITVLQDEPFTTP